MPHPIDDCPLSTDKERGWMWKTIDDIGSMNHGYSPAVLIESAVRQILRCLGEDINRPGIKDTPERVVRAYAEMFSGYHMKIEEIITTFPAEGYDQMIYMRDIPFSSTCEHHMLPFTGTATIGYIPRDHILGASKFSRVLDMFARRLQVQERLTHEVAHALEKQLSPKGVGVVIEAEHQCMSCRGIKRAGLKMGTSCMLGVFLTNDAARAEFLNLTR